MDPMKILLFVMAKISPTISHLDTFDSLDLSMTVILDLKYHKSKLYYYYIEDCIEFFIENNNQTFDMFIS